ncbi:hypothetical protein ASD40_33525 [Paenibacillus sp. Root444D2]|nr:hypothetical protein ASD40_33525 [Paenibacillus sp. Root444D2]KRE41229.1 hypothetical protein ASG85_34190 [Paenibacillus sp. Soil724D2]
MKKSEWLAGLSILGACALLCIAFAWRCGCSWHIFFLFKSSGDCDISSCSYYGGSCCLSAPKGKWNILHEARLQLQVLCKWKELSV